MTTRERKNDELGKATSPGRSVLSSETRAEAFLAPLTTSHPHLLVNGNDDNFRDSIYLIVEVLGKLTNCREAFGRSMGLTGSQFAVLIGVAYRQGEEGISIKRLADYVHLAATHVTTEVGRLQRKGLLSKQPGREDRRSVLVRLTPTGEASVVAVSAFVRRINDLLFSGITARDLAVAKAMFTRLSLNSEVALAEIKLAEREAMLLGQ